MKGKSLVGWVVKLTRKDGKLVSHTVGSVKQNAQIPPHQWLEDVERGEEWQTRSEVYKFYKSPPP